MTHPIPFQCSVCVNAPLRRLSHATIKGHEDHFYHIGTQREARGVAMGVYRYIYTPPPKKKISLPYNFFMWLLVVLFTCGTLTCFDFEIGMTS